MVLPYRNKGSRYSSEKRASSALRFCLSFAFYALCGKRQRLAADMEKPPPRQTSRASLARPVAAWNVVGPFPLDPGALAGLGPYARIVRPDGIPIPEFWHEGLPPEKKIDFGATYAGKAGAKTAWRPVEADRKGLVNLSALYPEIDFAVACGVAYVFSEMHATYTAGVGCDDLMTVHVNGEEIHTFYGPGQASREQKKLQITLRQGWNEIVLKTANIMHDWGFYFHIVDAGKTLRFALRPE